MFCFIIDNAVKKNKFGSHEKTWLHSIQEKCDIPYSPLLMQKGKDVQDEGWALHPVGGVTDYFRKYEELLLVILFPLYDRVYFLLIGCNVFGEC